MFQLDEWSGSKTAAGEKKVAASKLRRYRGPAQRRKRAARCTIVAKKKNGMIYYRRT